MANFTAIPFEADANSATFNGPLGELDAALGDLSTLTTVEQSNLVEALNEVRANALLGGIYVTQQQLKGWAESGAYEATSITYDTTYPLVVATATVKWPDASVGTFTATTINGTWETVDAYTITHASSGFTVTQAAVTRDINGRVTTKPALTVA